MNTRKQKIEELLAGMRSLRRAMALKSAGSAKSPRITPSQWGVLMLVEHSGKSTVKEIARALGITSSASTQLVDGLVKSGYLVRQSSSKDRRAVILTLSKKSKSHVDTMKQRALQKFLKIFEALNDKEFDAYFRLTEKIVERSVSEHTSSL